MEATSNAAPTRERIALRAVCEMHLDHEGQCSECQQSWPCNTVDVVNGILSGKIDWDNQEAEVEAWAAAAGEAR